MAGGVLSVVSFIKESTWGTALTPTKSIAVRPTGGFVTKEDTQLIPAIRGQLSKNYNAIKGKVSHEGSFTFDCFEDYVGYILLSALGTDTPATKGAETIVFVHSFTESAAKPSLTIEQAITEDVRRFAGSICNSFKISSKPGETVQVDASFLAKTFATATAITPAFTTVASFNHTQVVAKIGGSTIGEIENFEIEYKNNLEMVYALGSAEPSYNAPGGSEVTIKFDLYLDSTSLTRLTNYLALTPESCEIIITDPATIGSSSHPVLDILIPKVAYTAGETKITDKANVLSISGTGYYDTATSQLLNTQLTNLVASY